MREVWSQDKMWPPVIVSAILIPHKTEFQFHRTILNLILSISIENGIEPASGV